ncbi:MAG TPA: FdhF/YdeP family oxidoreductase, partial [Phycisphaerae bacterium]|nr:FdhF/YdeP family oxidoreductase [Phycisphaerae bacterium]
MKRPRSGGGWPAILYTLRMARRAGGLLRLYRALRRPNACKTCALGMGGQRGGMVNEAGRFPEVCKKSMQAMAADMQAPIDPRFFEQLSFDALRRLTPRELEHMGRLATPLYAGPDDDRYRAISWERALDFCAERLAAARPRPDESYFYFSGRSSNEAAFLWQLFARLYGTNNVNNCSYYCHQASGVGLSSAVGGGTATVTLDDLEHCDLVFLIGGNPASNHPRLMATLADVRRRGGNVVVVNPLREPGLVNFRIPSRPLSLLLGSKIASLYVQPNIGGDIALLTGVAKRVVELGRIDKRFIHAHTEGAAEHLESVRATDWDAITRAAGVTRDTIDRVADLYAASRATVFAWTMGVTHHEHGVDNVRAIANLALLRGMAGRPHAGLLPIRGHSNVQGVGSMGVTPKLRDAVFERLQTHFGVKLPTTPGLDTLSCVEAMQAGTVRHAWCLGGNLYGSNPDAQATAAAFGNLDSVAYLSTTLNTGHAWGRARHTLILPVKARDEESQPTTQESMFNYVRLSDGGPPRIPQARGEVEIVAELARRVLGESAPIDWRAMEQHRSVRAAIAAVIPGFEAIGRIDETRREFQIYGRPLHAPRV